MIARARYGPPTKTLTLLYKSLVQSRVDYGSIAYGTACKTSMEQKNIISGSILRVILGAQNSTPNEMLYAETGITPVKHWRQWVACRYLLKLS